MRKNDNSRNNHTDDDDDIDEKLHQYKLINKQMSKVLAAKKLEIANCKAALRKSSADIINLQMECHKWKKMFMDLRQMYIDHIQVVTRELQINALKINSISEEELDETKNSIQLVDELVASQQNTSKNPDDSRRDSKSFESTKNRSTKPSLDCEFIRN